MSVVMTALPGIPEVKPGDAVAPLILNAIGQSGHAIEHGDILVIAQKIISKSENCYVSLDSVSPSEQALRIAKETNKDPRKVQVILDESHCILRVHKHPQQETGVIITRHRLGFVSANAAVDESNIDKKDNVLCLPRAPDVSAQNIYKQMVAHTGKQIGIVITDTFGRPWRLGLVNVAIGLAGIPAMVDLTGQLDAAGRRLAVTKPAFADEVAAAAGLLMDKAGMTPVVHVRGLAWEFDTQSNASQLVRPLQEDLFQ